MITASDKAIEKLQEQLVRRCSEIGIGFRIHARIDESGKPVIIIKLDRQQQGDEILELETIRAFMDRSSATLVNEGRLDYQDGPYGGFFLNVRQEVNSGRN